jgi:hypothetical protein
MLRSGYSADGLFVQYGPSCVLVAEESLHHLKVPMWWRSIHCFSASKKEKADGDCYIHSFYGKCSRGLTCLFAESHTNLLTKTNKVDEDKWASMRSAYEHNHRQLLDKDSQNALRKHKFDFKLVDKLYSKNDWKKGEPNKKATSGTVTDENLVNVRSSEVKKVRGLGSLVLLFNCRRELLM